MEILSLTDNLCALPGYKAQHGLSLYIKTQKHMILFNLGQDSTFIRNARKLGVDIADIDTVIIFHGHYDHGGEYIRDAENLDRFRVHYYTCHCTGELAYLEMKKRLKGNLDYLAAGGQIQITDNGSYLKNPKEFSQKDLTKISNRRTFLRTNGSSVQPRGSPMKVAIIDCEKQKYRYCLNI